MKFNWVYWLNLVVILIDWINVNINVRYWVVWFNFLWLIFFCFDYLINWGMMFIWRSWMMIEVVMYGEIFIEKMEKFCIVLLFIKFNMLKNGKEERFCNEVVFMFGIVICVFRWNINNINIVNRIFDLMFFILKVFFNSLNIRLFWLIY